MTRLELLPELTDHQWLRQTRWIIGVSGNYLSALTPKFMSLSIGKWDPMRVPFA
jgi:hypothetical protein